MADTKKKSPGSIIIRRNYISSLPRTTNDVQLPVLETRQVQHDRDFAAKHGYNLNVKKRYFGLSIVIF